MSTESGMVNLENGHRDELAYALRGIGCDPRFSFTKPELFIIAQAVERLLAAAAASPPTPAVERGERRVVSAAIRYGVDGVIITGPRHFDTTMHNTIALLGLRDQHSRALQGFIDQRGVFMDRQEAWKVAEAAGQILFRCGGDESNGGTLYSENLY